MQGYHCGGQERGYHPRQARRGGPASDGRTAAISLFPLPRAGNIQYLGSLRDAISARAVVSSDLFAEGRRRPDLVRLLGPWARRARTIWASLTEAPVAAARLAQDLPRQRPRHAAPARPADAVAGLRPVMARSGGDAAGDVRARDREDGSRPSSCLIAVRGHRRRRRRVLDREDFDAKIERLLREYLFVFADDEGAEVDAFNGNIPQALLAGQRRRSPTRARGAKPARTWRASWPPSADPAIAPAADVPDRLRAAADRGGRRRAACPRRATVPAPGSRLRGISSSRSLTSTEMLTNH